MHNTGNPIGSKDILDLYDNSEVVDNFVNSQQDETPDRFGTKRLTLAGLIKRSMALRNEINDFSGALTFKPEWSDVPMNVSEGVGGDGGALNLQAEALGNRLEYLNVKKYKVTDLGFFTSDYTSPNIGSALITAIKAGEIVAISKPITITFDHLDSAVFLAEINKIKFDSPTTVILPSSIINMERRVLFDNNTLSNLTIRGYDPIRKKVTGGNFISGDSGAFKFFLKLNDTSNIEIGDYSLVFISDGDHNSKSLSGCWKVVGKTQEGVTIVTTLQNAPQILNVVSGDFTLIKTVIKFPGNTVGLAITSCIKEISNVIIDGSFQFNKDELADGAIDGLQVGSSPNTPETGLNESEQSNMGVAYISNVGIVNWRNNGAQILGKLVAVNSHISSCGWRGWQTARGGNLVAKKSSGSGNGASGYESEENGFLLAHHSHSYGNFQQGVFSIGGGSTVDFTFGFAGFNNSSGLDARNFASILADGAQISSNLSGLYSNSGKILFGAGAICSDNIRCDENGLVNCKGAEFISNDVKASLNSGSVIIGTDGKILFGNKITVFSGEHNAEIAISGIGDLTISSGSCVLVLKKDGNIYFTDNMLLGRRGNSLSGLCLKSPTGTEYKLSVTPDGSLVTTPII